MTKCCSWCNFQWERLTKILLTTHFFPCTFFVRHNHVQNLSSDLWCLMNQCHIVAYKGGIYCTIIGTAGRPLVSRCAVKRAARHTITLIDTRRRPHVFRRLQRSCTCPASVGCRRRCWQLNQRQAVNGFCVLHIWDLYVEWESLCQFSVAPQVHQEVIICLYCVVH